jgi:hypothetical protein
MTLLSVIRDVCAVVGVQQPASVTTNLVANRTMQEMLALANEMAQRIAYDTRDWTLFRKVNTFTGDGVKTSFNLPADYQRMLLTSSVWRSTQTLYPMLFVPDTDQWLNRRARNYYDAAGEWTILGGQMLIAPTMDSGIPLWTINTVFGANITLRDPADNSLWRSTVATTSGSGTFAADRAANPGYWISVPHTSVYFPYLEKNCVSLASGGYGNAFMADTDSFRLDERLLKLGMVWQWKQNKGTSYAEDMGTYSDALSIAMGHDSPAPIIIGRRPMGGGVRTAYPFPVPT